MDDDEPSLNIETTLTPSTTSKPLPTSLSQIISHQVSLTDGYGTERTQMARITDTEGSNPDSKKCGQNTLWIECGSWFDIKFQRSWVLSTPREDSSHFDSNYPRTTEAGG